MKTMLALLLVAIALLHVSDAGLTRFARSPYTGPPPNCQPGQTFQDDCNTCICGANGGPPACTMKGCLPPGFELNFKPQGN